jgi:hypothetical protein
MRSLFRSRWRLLVFGILALGVIPFGARPASAATTSTFWLVTGNIKVHDDRIINSRSSTCTYPIPETTKAVTQGGPYSANAPWWRVVTQSTPKCDTADARLLVDYRWFYEPLTDFCCIEYVQMSVKLELNGGLFTASRTVELRPNTAEPFTMRVKQSSGVQDDWAEVSFTVANVFL